MHRGKQLTRWIIFALVSVVCFVLIYVYLSLPNFRNVLDHQRVTEGILVTDRNGHVLRIYPDVRGRLGLWLNSDKFSPSIRAAVIAAEDKRFQYHPGFDLIAITRALYVNICKGRAVSGASTITQQVVRLLTPRPRTYLAKCIELLESVKMEVQLTKQEILELYLNLAPMGGNIRGVALASKVYFGKGVDQITVSEAAVLAAIPRSPSRFNPKSPQAVSLLMREKDRVLRRMAQSGMIASDELQLGLDNSATFVRRPLPLHAPHFVDSLICTVPQSNGTLETTLDLTIQRGVEQTLRSHARRLRSLGIQQAGAIVASTGGPEVLALVGSLGYRELAQGFNNAAVAYRGAGSTLKPFLYALALDQGYQTVTEIPDTFRSYSTPHGDYLPLNADRRLYGPVSIRSALGNSLNIPAVKLLKQVRVEVFYELLERVGLVQENARASQDYGLGLAVGNLEVNLFRLVQAYATLANRGLFQPLNMLKGDKSTHGTRVFADQIAYMVTNILADPTARLLTFGNPSYFDFGFPVALKTGTSSNHRDTWIVAYTAEHVIGIWAGNFDGQSAGATTGSGACGPILHDIIRFLYGARGPRVFERPQGIIEAEVCTMSGGLATSRCPYTTTDLVIIGREPDRCALRHDQDYHDLEAHYARWLLDREARYGQGRFRLMPASAEFVRTESVTRGLRVGRQSWGNSGIEIINPHHGDRFVFASQRPNVIRFQAQTDRLVEHVTWLVDGMEVGRTPPPYEFFWNLTRGDHVVHAVTPAREGARIGIQVE